MEGNGVSRWRGMKWPGGEVEEEGTGGRKKQTLLVRLVGEARARLGVAKGEGASRSFSGATGGLTPASECITITER